MFFGLGWTAQILEQAHRLQVCQERHKAAQEDHAFDAFLHDSFCFFLLSIFPHKSCIDQVTLSHWVGLCNQFYVFCKLGFASNCGPQALKLAKDCGLGPSVLKDRSLADFELCRSQHALDPGALPILGREQLAEIWSQGNHFAQGFGWAAIWCHLKICVIQ